MATLKLPFALEKPSASIGVCDVTEIWDSVNSQWLSTTVAGGGGGTTYSAGDGINISSNDVISVKAATASAYGGMKLGATDTTVNRAVVLDANGKAYVTMAAATALGSGVVTLSTSSTVTTDMSGDDDAKAVTPKAVKTAVTSLVSTAVNDKFVVMTKAAYDLITPDSGTFYFCTEN